MRRKIARITLAGLFGVSVLLNAVVIGAGIRLWQVRGDDAGVVLRMDRDLRRDMLSALRDDPEISAAREDLAQARAHLSGLLSDNAPDRAALERAGSNVRRATTTLQALLHERMIELKTED